MSSHWNQERNSSLNVTPPWYPLYLYNIHFMVCVSITPLCVLRGPCCRGPPGTRPPTSAPSPSCQTPPPQVHEGGTFCWAQALKHLKLRLSVWVFSLSFVCLFYFSFFSLFSSFLPASVFTLLNFTSCIFLQEPAPSGQSRRAWPPRPAPFPPKLLLPTPASLVRAARTLMCSYRPHGTTHHVFTHGTTPHVFTQHT